jgi:hypothetical protein
VIENQDVLVAQVFCGLDPIADRHRVFGKLIGRKHGSNTHRRGASFAMARRPSSNRVPSDPIPTMATVSSQRSAHAE